MKTGGHLLTAAAVLAVAGCAANNAELKIRATPSSLAQGERPVSFRVAEARGQLALGNVALALEGFRKAQREDPQSIDAALGMATCYDRMGRFDLSDRYFQMALAVDPANGDVLTALAMSLDRQGKPADAAQVRQEIATNLALEAAAEQSVHVEAAAPATPVEPRADRLASVAVAIAAAREPSVTQVQPAASVTISLPRIDPPAKAVRTAGNPADPHLVMADKGRRLERTTLGEVALITSGAPAWKSEVVDRSRLSTTVRFVPLPQPVQRVAAIRLLNAARVHRLAARTRSLLAEVGWSKMTIGDAPSTRRQSLIVYPARERATAERLAARFGFRLAKSNGAQLLTIYLGHDAVPLVAKRT